MRECWRCWKSRSFERDKVKLSRHLQRIDSSVAPRLQLSWKAVLVVIIYRTLSPRHKNHMYKPDIKCFQKKIADFDQNKVLKSFASSGNKKINKKRVTEWQFKSGGLIFTLCCVSVNRVLIMRGNNPRGSEMSCSHPCDSPKTVPVTVRGNTFLLDCADWTCFVFVK